MAGIDKKENHTSTIREILVANYYRERESDVMFVTIFYAMEEVILGHGLWFVDGIS